MLLGCRGAPDVRTFTFCPTHKKLQRLLLRAGIDPEYFSAHLYHWTPALHALLPVVNRSKIRLLFWALLGVVAADVVGVVAEYTTGDWFLEETGLECKDGTHLHLDGAYSVFAF